MLDNALQIIDDCIAGKDVGWTVLYEDYAPFAMNILNKHFLNVELIDKEDIIQNAFLKLIKGGLTNFQGTSKYEFLAYFKKIVTNEALTYLSTTKKRENTVSINQEKDCGDGRIPPLDIPDDKPIPDTEMERKEFLQLVYAVLNDCPIESKQIFLMKIDGYKDKEVSGILGISMGTVASRYSRIKEKMRQILGNHDTEEKQ